MGSLLLLFCHDLSEYHVLGLEAVNRRPLALSVSLALNVSDRHLELTLVCDHPTLESVGGHPVESVAIHLHL